MINKTNYLSALIENDSKIIGEMYTKIFPKVVKFVLQNKGQRVDAEDIFQKALLQISARYRKRPFIIKSSFEAYVFSACKNLWRRELNKAKIKVTESTILELHNEDRDMAVAILERERWELFTEKLSDLTGNCKKILELFFAKVPYSDIVKEFNYSSEIVARQRVFKCKASLMQHITNDDRYNSLKEL